jgi:hypothetical protein
VQHAAQVAQRPEHFGAEQQDDEQGLEPQGALSDPVGAQPERRRRAEGDAGVGDAARQGVGGQHPHGRAKHLLGLDGEQAAARAALTEGLERGQPLDRVEELGGEVGIGPGPRQGVFAVPAMEGRRRDQSDQGGGEEGAGHRQVDPGDEGEDQYRRDGGHEKLRQVFAEVDLQMLDGVHQGDHHVPRAGQAQMGRPQFDDLVVKRLAQVKLNLGGRSVGDHDAGVLEGATQGDDHGNSHAGGQQLLQRQAAEHLAQKPPDQGETRDAQGRGKDAKQDRPEDASAHPFGKGPELPVEVHGCSCSSSHGVQALFSPNKYVLR